MRSFHNLQGDKRARGLSKYKRQPKEYFLEVQLRDVCADYANNRHKYRSLDDFKPLFDQISDYDPYFNHLNLTADITFDITEMLLRQKQFKGT